LLFKLRRCNFYHLWILFKLWWVRSLVMLYLVRHLTTQRQKILFWHISIELIIARTCGRMATNQEVFALNYSML